MARTFITGLAGFTGHYLRKRLSAEGDEIFGLVHQDAPDRADAGDGIYRGDLTDLTRLEDIIAAVRPDRVVHLAAIAFVAHGHTESMYRTNLLGTRNLLEALARSKCCPQTVLLASSANVYGTGQGGVLTEDAEPQPANDYAVSKIAMEYVSRLYVDRLPLIVTRPFNYTGVGQSVNFLVPKIVDHVRRRADVIELGNLDVARDWSDVRMLVDAYARLLAAPSAVGGTFNICSGKAHNLRELFDIACEIGKHRMQIKVNPAFVRANDVRTLTGSKDRLEAAIGPIDGPSIRDTLAWMLM